MPRYRDDEYEDDEDDHWGRPYRRGETAGRPRRESGHSTIGIVSFAAAVLSGVMVFALFVIAGVMAAKQGGDIAENSPEAMLAGLGIIAGMGVALLALVLGVVGLFQEGKKLFPTLGTTMSGIVLLGTVALLCAGVMFG
jgi:hypothetical protein